MTEPIEINPAAQEYYDRVSLAAAMAAARETIDEWSYEDDPHGYCHDRPVLVRLLEAIERKPELTADQAQALDAMALHAKGLEYSEQTMLNGGPYGGQTVKTAPDHDHLYIQDREAKWVYIKRASSDPGRAQYDFARREPLE